ncbi:MAG: acyl-CoA dehydrogenase family protein, partial [Thermoleophilia bacterium]|nr:acyl-CoA dehydrogenase family protein [Thermoleophilia bacterium]
MIDFSLTEEQHDIQLAVRAFVDERVLPVAVQNDMEHKLDFGLIDGMRELGVLGAPIPTEWGGAGLDFIAEALICEEIERGEAALRTLVSVHVGLNSLSLLGNASDEQKERWLRPQATGEKLACFGLTEPNAGSDVAAMQTTAIRQGDGSYVLNGEKSWISYAAVADHALVFAKTDPGAGARGISAFLVDLKADAGVTTSDYPHKLGVWAGSTGSIFFDDCVLPADRLVGQEGAGFKIAMYSLDHGRFTVAAGAVGVIRACLEASTKYANERETMGQR